MKIKKVLFGIICSCFLFSSFFALNNKKISAKADSAPVVDGSGLRLDAFTHTKDFDNGDGLLHHLKLYDTDGIAFETDSGRGGGVYLNDHLNDMSDGNGNYFTDYILFGNKTFREIVTLNQNGATNYSYPDAFPLSIGGAYAPITIFFNPENYCEIRIMGKFIEDQGYSLHGMPITLKAGCPFRYADGTLVVLAEDMVSVMPAVAGEPEKFSPVSNATNLHVIDVPVKTTDRNMPTFQIAFDKNLSLYEGYWILDHKIALTAFITINGESIQEINARTDDSSYDYSDKELAGGTNPSVCYNRPIRVFVNSGAGGNVVSVSIHPSLMSNLFSDGDYVDFGVRKGFAFVSGSTAYYQSVNTSVRYYYSSSTADRYFTPFRAGTFIQGELEDKEFNLTSSTGALSRENDGNFYSFRMTSNVTFGCSKFDLNDANFTAGYNLFFRDNIIINGTSVEVINSNTDVTGWNFSSRFPQSVGAPYNVPILVEAEGTSLTLVMHKEFAKTLAENSTIKVLEGASIYFVGEDGAKCDEIYSLPADVEFTLSVGKDRADVRYFVNTYMHMDYTEDLGYCADSTHAYFAFAQAAYNELTVEQKNMLATDAEFASAFARLQAWATINGESLDANSSGAKNSIGNQFNGSYVLITIISLSSLAVVGFFLIKKKHN